MRELDQGVLPLGLCFLMNLSTLFALFSGKSNEHELVLASFWGPPVLPHFNLPCNITLRLMAKAAARSTSGWAARACAGGLAVAAGFYFNGVIQ